MAEKEYIEREAALDIVTERCPDDDGSVGKIGDLRDMLDELEAIPAADVVPGRDFRGCRNELCLRCGEYKMRHKGACDGCRWRDA